MNDAFTETHRSFVNTWECDENSHMNVQFYNRRFDEAARFFAHAEGGAFDIAQPRVRNIRYHGELHASDITRIRSARIASGPMAGRVAHRLENADSGVLCATALDLSGDAPAATTGVEATDEFLPRSLSAEPAVALPANEVLAAGGIVTHRRILGPADCDARGEMNAQAYLSIGSDAAPHVWQNSGFGGAGLVAQGFGRVAVEMRLTHHRSPRSGEAVLMVSLPTRIEGRTLLLHHELVRAADHESLATLNVVSMVIDLNTRRSVPAEGLAELLRR